MNRVPHCSDCERCRCIEHIYKEYYCCEENEPSQILGLLGVDYPPKTSPKWCPNRVVSSNQKKAIDSLVKVPTT